MSLKNSPIYHFDTSRNISLPGNWKETILFAAQHLVNTGREAIAKRGAFFLALSGGTTPKAIFQQIASSHKNALDWSKVWIFWSDERAVPPYHPDSNYKMAMDHGIVELGIPQAHIHRMQAEQEIQMHAEQYETLIRKHVDQQQFDLIMLGMGDDGHTASLFPDTEALGVTDRLVVANHVPQKNTYRMTFTYPLINAARNSVLYVLGSAKKERITEVLFDKNRIFPSGRIGTKKHPALWILDNEAASVLLKKWEPKTKAA